MLERIERVPPLQEESIEREKRHTHAKSADAHTNITTIGDRTPRGGVLHGNVTRAHAQAYAQTHMDTRVYKNANTHGYTNLHSSSLLG